MNGRINRVSMEYLNLGNSTEGGLLFDSGQL
jgi:hypothetical protein